MFYEKMQNCALHNLKAYPMDDRNADPRFVFTSRDISNFLWGLSKSLKSQKFNAQSIDPELISMMLQRLVADNFGGKQSVLNVSMTVWALANCKCQVPAPFMNALNQEIPTWLNAIVLLAVVGAGWVVFTGNSSLDAYLQ